MKPILTSLAFLAILAATRSATAAPANDKFAKAQALVGTYATADGTNVGATKEPSEPGYGAYCSVWYYWVAPGNGSVEFGLLSTSAVDTFVFESYSGTDFTNLTLLQRNSGGFSKDRRVTSTVTQGDRIYLRIADAYTGSNTVGTFTVSALHHQTYPANDNVANAATLAGNNPSSSASLKGATRESGEPSTTGNNTLWWKWTAPSTGTTVFSSEGSQYPADTIVSVFSGTTLSNMQLLSSQQGDVPISLRTTSGVKYLIALGSASTTTYGTGVLTIAHSPDPGTGGGGGGNSTGSGGAFTTHKKKLASTAVVRGRFYNPDDISNVRIRAKGKASVGSGSYNRSTGAFSFVSKKRGNSRRPVRVTFILTAFNGQEVVAQIRKTYRLR